METAVQPDKILKELDELWASLGKQTNGESLGGVLRACALTLIVVTENAEDASAVGETLAELMRQHPCRAIVVNLLAEEAPRLEARVFAQCWLPLGQRRQICSEQIEITTTGASLPDVPAVVLALAVPDLPVVLWCRGPRLFQFPASQALISVADKLILDSAAFEDPRALLSQMVAARDSGPVMTDLAWTRLTRWREVLAQIFEDSACLARRREISGLTICYGGKSTPAAAYYLAAWLALALGWRLETGRFRFQGFPGEPGAEILRVTLAAPNLSISVGQADGCAVEVQVDSFIHRTVFAMLADHALLSEELSIAGRDPVYENTLTLAEQIAALEKT